MSPMRLPRKVLMKKVAVHLNSIKKPLKTSKLRKKHVRCASKSKPNCKRSSTMALN